MGVRHLTLGDEEQLVVEAVPVHRGPALAGGHLEQHAADAVLGARAVLVDADCERADAEGFGGGLGVEFDGDGAADWHFGFVAG